MEDELTKDDEVKIPERDRFIYDVVTARHKFEWKRFSQIESKATTTLGFLGVIFSLQTTTGLYILKSVQDGYNINYLAASFFILSLLFLFTSLIFGLNSFWMREWYAVPNIKHFMSNYVNADKNCIEIIQSLYNIYEDSIDRNYRNNKEKIKILEYSLRYFAVALVLLFLFIFTLIIASL